MLGHKKNKQRLLIIIIIKVIVFIILSCNSSVSYNPRGYFKIDTPALRQYTLFNKNEFPYSFEYPVYGNIVQDSSFFYEHEINNYWVNVDFPQYKAKIYLSYSPINGKAVFKIKQKNGTYKDSIGIMSFEKLIHDAFTLTNKHLLKATEKTEQPIRPSPHTQGILFELGGNVASLKQFFLTDSARHFIRGALYFEATPNEDSIRPISNYLFTDMLHLVQTLKWKQ